MLAANATLDNVSMMEIHSEDLERNALNTKIVLAG